MPQEAQPELGSLNSRNLVYKPWGAQGVGGEERSFGAWRAREESLSSQRAGWGPHPDSVAAGLENLSIFPRISAFQVREGRQSQAETQPAPHTG